MKRLSVLCAAILLLLAAFVAGVYSQQRDTPLAQAVLAVYESLRLAWREAQAMAGAPPWFQHPARHPGSGVTHGADMDDGALILLAGFLPGKPASSYLRLIRRDGSTVVDWDLRELQLPPSKLERQGLFTHHLHAAVLEPDGSPTIVMDGLAKVTRCGELSLFVDENLHHDLARAEGGGYWTLGWRMLDRSKVPADYLPPFTSARFHGLSPRQLRAQGVAPHIRADTVVRVGEDGEVLLELSIPKLLYDNGLQQIIGRFHKEGRKKLIHANSVHELTSELAPAFPMFARGDLLLSLRNVHLLLVVDPVTRKVKWHRTGPWAWQHDARFQPDGAITLFNNRYLWEDPTGSLGLHSNVLRLDPADGSVQVLAGREISEQSRFYTATRGHHQMLPGGDVLVVSSERGRVLQLDPQGRILWAYLNRLDEDRVGLMRSARVYPADYFAVDDWSCPPR